MEYIIIWGISLAILSLALNKDEEAKQQVKDGEGTWSLFFLAPLLAVAIAAKFIFLCLWKALTYFTSEARHKRALKSAEQERELWETTHGIKHDDIETLLKEDEISFESLSKSRVEEHA